MSYSTLAHAMISYVECHLEHFSLTEMSKGFGFSEIYLRELFLKNINMPIMQYYRRRQMIASAFELLYSDKTIMDIALESGFSNHESYTRAFRRIFDMPPSQFRRSRPLIGGTQLDAGVYGLDRLAEKRKRSDKYMATHCDSSTILYGIREIKFGSYESNTAFPICIKAVSEYLGDDISYADIMATTGAAFRLTWNQKEWDLSNIDIYHTLKESNEIYGQGAKALGREFSFLGRDENTTKETFTEYIKSNLANGCPVIALGIIGPPEPCIIAGYDAAQDAVMGWNFFQHDPEFASTVSTMENGYFRCTAWWENADTQAVMCIGPLADPPCDDREIIKMAADIMEPRYEGTYAKGLAAYDAWKEMLLDEKWFENQGGFDSLFSMLLVQKDAMNCISDGRKWAAKYFEKLAEDYSETKASICLTIAESFRTVSRIAEEMNSLIGSWNDTENMLQNFGSQSVREKLGALIAHAKREDTLAYETIRTLLKQV